MPSKAVYLQTADGYLSRRGQEDASWLAAVDNVLGTSMDLDQFNSMAAFSPATSEETENDFNFDMDECCDLLSFDSSMETMASPTDDEFHTGTGPTISHQWQKDFVDQPLDMTPNHVFLNHAIRELEEPYLSQRLPSDSALPHPELVRRDQSRDLQRRSYRGYSSLTAPEERKLLDIAMPSYKLPAPAVEEEEEDSSYQPELKRKTRNKKRKPILDIQGADAVKRKRGHNAIEKRYRTNLNDKIIALRQSIPSLRIPQSGQEEEQDVDGSDQQSPETPHGCGKAAILTRAVEYIAHLEESVQQLGGSIAMSKVVILRNPTITAGASPPTSPQTNSGFENFQLRKRKAAASQQQSDATRRSRRREAK